MENKHQDKSPNKPRLYRRRRRLSQKQVAHLLGHKDTSMLSRYERGRSTPPLEVAMRIGIILRIPIKGIWNEHYLEMREKIRSEEERLAGRGQQVLF